MYRLMSSCKVTSNSTLGMSTSTSVTGTHFAYWPAISLLKSSSRRPPKTIANVQLQNRRRANAYCGVLVDGFYWLANSWKLLARDASAENFVTEDTPYLQQHYRQFSIWKWPVVIVRNTKVQVAMNRKLRRLIGINGKPIALKRRWSEQWRLYD